MTPRDQPIFRPTREGLAKVLGELEADVMEFVWSQSAPVSARTVDDEIGPRTRVQYITLVTVLNNLWKKKLLTRRREGRAYLYSPRITRDDFLRRVSKEILSGIVSLDRDLAITCFVDILAESAPDELQRLKEQLAARRKELEQ